jgi:integrase
MRREYGLAPVDLPAGILGARRASGSSSVVEHYLAKVGVASSSLVSRSSDAGMHMLHLQLLLGHASSDMTAQYYRGRTDEAILQAAARVRF